MKKNLIASFILLFFLHTADAQIELATIKFNKTSTIGFGSFINVPIKIANNSYVTVEASLYRFNPNDELILTLPCLIGYRKIVLPKGDNGGFFVEPNIGDTFGGSSTIRIDANNNQVYENGNPVYQKVNGISSGLVAGYIFGKAALAISVRYLHEFITIDPSINMFSIRLAHNISLKNFLKRKSN